MAATGGHEDVAELLRRHHVMLSASLRVENQEPIAASSPSPDGMERDGLARCYVSWEWFFCRSGIIATRCRLMVGPTRLGTARPRDAPVKPRHRNWPPEADVQMRAVISDFVNTETGPQMPCLRGHFA